MYCINANCFLRKQSSHGQQYYRLSHSEISISSPRGISVISDLYLSLITFLILPTAALVDIYQNLFPSVSRFSRDFYLPFFSSPHARFLGISISRLCHHPAPISLAAMEAPVAQPSPCPWAAQLGGKFIAAPLVPSPAGEIACHYSRTCPTHNH